MPSAPGLTTGQGAFSFFSGQLEIRKQQHYSRGKHMYIVMTVAEACQFIEPDGTHREPASAGNQVRPEASLKFLEEICGLSGEELDAYHICIPEDLAQQMGILAAIKQIPYPYAGEKAEVPKARPPVSLLGIAEQCQD